MINDYWKRKESSFHQVQTNQKQHSWRFWNSFKLWLFPSDPRPCVSFFLMLLLALLSTLFEEKYWMMILCGWIGKYHFYYHRLVGFKCHFLILAEAWPFLRFVCFHGCCRPAVELIPEARQVPNMQPGTAGLFRWRWRAGPKSKMF